MKLDTFMFIPWIVLFIQKFRKPYKGVSYNMNNGTHTHTQGLTQTNPAYNETHANTIIV